MTLLLALALLVGHCPVPHAAYVMDRDLTVREFRAMERFGHCLCGPDGTVDYDPRPHKHGGVFAHPSCNRNRRTGR
jgi:hypothetical protein